MAEQNPILQEIRKEFAKRDTRFDAIENKLSSVGNKVDSVEAKVDSVEAKVDMVEAKVDMVESKVNAMETTVAQVKDKLGEVDEATTKNGVLLEHVRSEVHAVAEQHGSIITRLDAQAEMLGGMAEDLTQVRIDGEYTLRKLDAKADKAL